MPSPASFTSTLLAELYARTIRTHLRTAFTLIQPCVIFLNGANQLAVHRQACSTVDGRGLMSLALDDIWELFALKANQFKLGQNGKEDEVWNLAASLLMVKNEQIKDLLYDGKKNYLNSD